MSHAPARAVASPSGLTAGTGHGPLVNAIV